MLPSPFEPTQPLRPLLRRPARSPRSRIPRRYLYFRGHRRAQQSSGPVASPSAGLEPATGFASTFPTALEIIDLYLACVKLGVIFVPINILYRERELAHILTDAEPVAFVSLHRIPESRTPIWNPLDLTREAAALPNERPGSGSGRRCARRHHLYFRHHRRLPRAPSSRTTTWRRTRVNLLTCWQITSADRFLLTLPLFHVHGLGNGLHSWLIERMPHAFAGTL